MSTSKISNGAKISIAQVKLLRKETNLSVMECKKALKKAGGDFKKAKIILLGVTQGLAEKKLSREVKQGIVEAYIHSNGRIGTMVELYCETDFVAKSKEFKELAHDLAMQVAAGNPIYLKPGDIPSNWLKQRKESLREEFSDKGKSADVVERIAEGKVQKEIQEICLYSQLFIKNPDQSVEDYIKEKIAKLGENIKVGKFVRFKL